MASGTPRIISRQILVAVEVDDLDHLRGLETEQVNAPFDVLDEHGYAPYNRSYRNVLDYAIRKFGGSATPAVVAVLLDKGAAIPAGLLTTVAGEASYRHAKDASLADESLEILRLLIEHGADVNYRDEEGMTALHAAASYHTPAFAAALLSAGADANAYRTIVQQAVRDEFSDFEDEEDEMNPPTPLMAAAKASVSCELVRLLLSRGADFERRDRAGRTASDFAREAVVGERYDRHVFSNLSTRTIGTISRRGRRASRARASARSPCCATCAAPGPGSATATSRGSRSSCSRSSAGGAARPHRRACWRGSSPRSPKGAAANGGPWRRRRSRSWKRRAAAK